MSSSNDNNSANNQITQGLDIESEADASMNIPSQHGAISSGQPGPRTRSQAGISTPRVITAPIETSNPTPRRRRNTRRRQANVTDQENNSTPNDSNIIPGTNINVNDIFTQEQANNMLNMIQNLSREVQNTTTNVANLTNTITNLTDIRQIGEAANTSNPVTSNPVTSNPINSNSLITTNQSINNNSSLIPYSDLNADNYTNYNIDWSQFNSVKYNNIRFQNKTIKDAIKNIPTPPIDKKNPQNTNPISLLTWYREFEDIMTIQGIHTFLFKREFNPNTDNPVEIEEDRYVRSSVLYHLFPDDYLHWANARNSSSLFHAIKHKYFPKRPSDLANKLENDLDVSYTCDVSLLDTTFTTINMLRKIAKDPPLEETTYVSHLMGKAINHFASAFSTIYDDWIHNKSKYTLSYTIRTIESHIDQTPDYVQDSVPSSTRPHEINNISYKKTRYDQNKPLSKYPKAKSKRFGVGTDITAR